MVQACRMASAGRITAVVPYFPYGKWSKKKRARGPITAKRTPLPTAYIYIYTFTQLMIHLNGYGVL